MMFVSAISIKMYFMAMNNDWTYKTTLTSLDNKQP